MPDDYAVIFSGGGAFGAWEVGCLEAVLAHHGGTQPRIVTGASAGAINAAGMCAGISPHQLHQLWKGLRPQSVFRPRELRGKMLKAAISATRNGLIAGALKQLETLNSIYETDPLSQTLSKILKPAAAKFKASPISLAISSTNLTERGTEIFYKVPPGRNVSAMNLPAGWKAIDDTDVLIQALMGTTALPLLFPPMEGHFDGGVLLNQPISPALTLGATTLYVFLPTSQRLGTTRNLLEIGSALLTTWLAASLTSQIERVKLRNDIRGLMDEPKFKLCVVRPLFDLSEHLGIQLLSFGERVDELVALGSENARDRLALFDPANEDTWY